MKRGQAEVVEQVLAPLEIGQMGAAHQQQERLNHGIARPDAATEPEGSLGVGSRDHDGTAPSVVRAAVGNRIDTADPLPRQPGPVEGVGQFRRSRVGVDEQWAHQHNTVMSEKDTDSARKA